MGAAIALALAGEGARVAVADLQEDLLTPVVEQIEAGGSEALARVANVTEPAAVDALLKTVQERFGRLDILVNTAGINVARRNLEDLSPADWRAVVDTNLTGTFICVRAALPLMRAQGRGTVINMVSWAGKRPIRMAGVAYSAAKTGMMALTEFINMEERRHGIRACSICPGEVNTPLVAKRANPPSLAEREAMLQVEDIVASVVFIATLPQRVTVEELSLRPTTMREGYDPQVLRAE